LRVEEGGRVDDPETAFGEGPAGDGPAGDGPATSGAARGEPNPINSFEEILSTLSCLLLPRSIFITEFQREVEEAAF
jgi:hypothetical protein